jgi:ureidoglycolate hydrolase
MARPDGTFYLQPANFEDNFVMAVALPDPNTGEPQDNTLQAFRFSGKQTIR